MTIGHCIEYAVTNCHIKNGKTPVGASGSPVNWSLLRRLAGRRERICLSRLRARCVERRPAGGRRPRATGGVRHRPATAASARITSQSCLIRPVARAYSGSSCTQSEQPPRGARFGLFWELVRVGHNVWAMAPLLFTRTTSQSWLIWRVARAYSGFVCAQSEKPPRGARFGLFWELVRACRSTGAAAGAGGSHGCCDGPTNLCKTQSQSSAKRNRPLYLRRCRIRGNI